MTPTITRSVALLTLATSIAAFAADEKPKAAQPAKPSAAQQRADKAKGKAPDTEPLQRASEAQLQIADRVLTGDASCEFNQVVNLARIDGHPGHFKLTYKKVAYTVVPEETTTGALRLEDRKAGIVWLQIPSKSMLMNSKLGQRMVDNCLHPEQRAAVNAAEGAGERKP
jgi:hypothetical protein